jgi:hypothetical protein
MTMPAPETEEDAAPSAMDDAFFWYVVWRVGLSTAIGLCSFVYFIVVGVIDAANAAAFQAEAEAWIGEHRLVAVALSVVLCIAVASWYRIGFWRAAVVFIAGSLIATIICIPMFAAAYIGDRYPGTIWAVGYFAILVLYAVGCGYVIIRRRRQTRRRYRTVAEVFD